MDGLRISPESLENGLQSVLTQKSVSSKSETSLVAKNGILIVGAGLAGLTLALALSKLGIASTVIEKQQQIEPSKWSILVYPQGIQIFDKLGVLEELRKLGIPLSGPEMVVNGESLLQIDNGLLVEPRYNYYMNLGPSEIRQALERQALSQGVEILNGIVCMGFVRNSSNKITGVLTKGNAGNQDVKIACNVVIDATGYRSNLRNQLPIQSSVVEHDSLVVSFFVDNFEHRQDRIQLFPGNGYESVSLPCTKTRINLAYQEKGLSFEKLGEKGGETYVKRRILDAAPNLWQVMERATANLADGSMITIRPTISRVEPFTVDGAVVIGDSAHSVHPATGSGAQMAFQDAMVLAPIIQNCLNKANFSSALLKEYELARRPLMKIADITSRSVDSIVFAKGPIKHWLRTRQLRAINKLMSRKEYQELIAGIRAPTGKEVLILTLRTMVS